MTTSPLPMAIVLAGGQGSRLCELTHATCKPAVRFGGQWRIVDWTMANLARASIGRAIVALQYKPRVLGRHIDTVLSGHFGRDGIVQMHGPELTGTVAGFRGTADALRQILAAVPPSKSEIVVLGADHIYDMDYDAMVAAHRATGAEATVGACAVPRMSAHEFGVLSADDASRVTAFLEKPANPPGLSDDPHSTMVSMGIYVFDQGWLRQMLARHAWIMDIGHDLLPLAQEAGGLFAHRGRRDDGRDFYWRDVGSLDAFREAHCEFVTNRPCSVPIGVAGCLATDAQTRRGNALLCGAWADPTARLTRTILAPNTRVTGGIVIGEDPEEDARWFRVTSGGTTLVTGAMLARFTENRNRSYLVGSHLAFRKGGQGWRL